MIEDKSRLKILVIEDKMEFGGNALEALDNHDVTLATNLEAAMKIGLEVCEGRRPRFDFILSDVHFPVNDGEEPRANVSKVLDIARALHIPVCFVTQADHHGLLDLGGEGYIALRALDSGRMFLTEMNIQREGRKPCESELFRDLEGKGENIKSSSKTPDVWRKALQMVQNLSIKPGSVTAAMRKVRKVTGLDTVAEGRVPKLAPPRKLRR